MSIKNIFCGYFFLVSVFAVAQNLAIEYKYSIVDNKDEYGLAGFGYNKLITNNKESNSYSKSIDTLFTVDVLGDFSQTASNYAISDYKNLSEKIYYSKTLFPNYLLKDDSYTINWTLVNQYKDILGYKCQKATSDFRGRSYEAYFTTEIPIRNGPYKFDGLPGLVLEVNSTDGAVSYKAVNITEVSQQIENPFTNLQYISWEQFKKAYNDYFHRMINYMPEENMSIIVPNRGIEYYITD